MTYKIYTLSDSTGEDIFYVGCTRNTLAARLSEHLRDASPYRYSDDTKFTKGDKIYALRYEVLITVVEVVESQDKKVIKAAENKWIEYYLKKGYNLTNIKVPKSKVVIEEKEGYSISSVGMKSYHRYARKLKKVV
jgi:hypothetical protein